MATATHDPARIGAGSESPFLADIRRCCARIRGHLERGTIVPGYHADRDTIIAVLAEARNARLAWARRFAEHGLEAGATAPDAVSIFRRHRAEEHTQASRLARRIEELGGSAPRASLPSEPAAAVAAAPDLQPHPVHDDRPLSEQVREDLVATRLAQATHLQVLGYLAFDDPVTARQLREVRDMEERHASALAGLLGERLEG